VLVTNGSLMGVSLLAEVLVDPGAKVLVEGPTYDRALHIIARNEGEPVPLAMDEDGLDPDAIELPAAFLYTIPTFQNPSGRALSLERRHRLAELARDGKLLIVEDDPYSLVRYEGEPLPSIYELAGGEGVLLLLEDRRTRPARRLPRRSGGADRAARGAGGADLSDPGAAAPGNGVRVRLPGTAGAEPRARDRPAQGAA
jgi:hypothetical protein